MYLFFLYKLNDFDVGKSITQVTGRGVVLFIYVLCGLVCLLDCTLYIIFVVIHPTEYNPQPHQPHKKVSYFPPVVPEPWTNEL
jgi:hypothetical protein